MGTKTEYSVLVYTNLNYLPQLTAEIMIHASMKLSKNPHLKRIQQAIAFNRAPPAKPLPKPVEVAPAIPLPKPLHEQIMHFEEIEEQLSQNDLLAAIS